MYQACSVAHSISLRSNLMCPTSMISQACFYDDCSGYQYCFDCVQDSQCGYCGNITSIIGRHAYGCMSQTDSPLQCSSESTISSTCSDSNIYPWLIFLSMCLYLLCFAPGLGTMPWCYTSEIYPTNVRGICNSITTTTNWLTNLFMSLTFLTIADVLSLPGAFLLYAFIAAVFFVLLLLILPETLGLGLEDIRKLFEDDSHVEVDVDVAGCWIRTRSFVWSLVDVMCCCGCGQQRSDEAAAEYKVIQDVVPSEEMLDSDVDDADDDDDDDDDLQHLNPIQRAVASRNKRFASPVPIAGAASSHVDPAAAAANTISSSDTTNFSLGSINLNSPQFFSFNHSESFYGDRTHQQHQQQLSLSLSQSQQSQSQLSLDNAQRLSISNITTYSDLPSERSTSTSSDMMSASASASSSPIIESDSMFQNLIVNSSPQAQTQTQHRGSHGSSKTSPSPPPASWKVFTAAGSST